MAELVLEGIKKSFGAVDVIHGIDLAIHDGEFVVLVGPSGCGKSTLLRMIAGLEQITAGTLKIDGRVVNDVETRERDIAMVFQSYALYPHMTVRENINFPLKVRGVDKAAGDQRVIEACDMIGLGDLLARKPKALSGGQRQRVAMGRSVVRHPRVFLFDEPLSNLDAKLRVQMRRQIRDLHRRIGATSIYVTHDQVEAMTLADRIVLLDQGYVQQIGTPLELYREPANRFVASFIGSPEMNLLEGVVEAAERGMIARIGPDFAIPIGAGSVADGTPVTVGIRPADIAVGAGDVTGAVIECEILGSETHLLIGRGGHEIQISVPGIAPSAAGDEVPLRFAPEHVHLFSRETGMRL